MEREKEKGERENTLLLFLLSCLILPTSPSTFEASTSTFKVEVESEVRRRN